MLAAVLGDGLLQLLGVLLCVVAIEETFFVEGKMRCVVILLGEPCLNVTLGGGKVLIVCQRNEASISAM